MSRGPYLYRAHGFTISQRGRKVTAVVRGTDRRRMSIALGRRSEHFAQCVAVARRIEIVEVDRPRDLNALHRLGDALEADRRGPR